MGFFFNEAFLSYMCIPFNQDISLYADCLNLQHSFLSLHDTVLNTAHGIAHMSSSSQSSKETTIAYFWILKVL